MFKVGAQFWAVFVLAVAGTCGIPAQATDLPDMLRELLNEHDRIAASRQNLVAATERLEESFRVYYPDIALTTFVGREDRRNSNADDTTLTGREMNITITQRLLDFGVSESTVNLAKYRLRRAEALVEQTEEQVLLEALAAYIDLARTARVVEFSIESVDNINRQANLEDARVKRGGGFSTDVLQAQTQLVGARARSVLAEGDLELAENRFISVFGYEAETIPTGDEVVVPADLLPSSLEEALVIAQENNAQIIVTRLDEDISKETSSGTESDVLFPEIDIVGEQVWSNDVDGVQDLQTESIIRLQMTYEFDVGLTARNTIRAAEADAKASGFGRADVLRQVEESVRDAWVQLRITRQNAELLEEQAILAERFLELAREERKAGRRSLIDVLAGETALNNAQSDAISARLNVKVAALALLAAMGTLDLDTVAP